MSEFGLVIVIASVASVLTFLGAPLAERFDVPQRVVSGALQFAAGIITALVAFSLMPTAIQNGPPFWVALAFFAGGASFVAFDFVTSRESDPNEDETAVAGSIALYAGVLMDLIIDGAVIGIGATLTLATGLLLAVGMALSTMPLAFVTISTAKRQGMPREQRRLLSAALLLCVLVGAVVGYLVVRNLSDAVSLTLISFAGGFLITTVTQALVPEALHGKKADLTGLLYVAGLTIYAVISLAFSPE